MSLRLLVLHDRMELQRGLIVCTLIEGVHIMLMDSKLPHTFWAEALSTCAYLQNHSPTKAL